MRSRDLYAILGVPRGASAEEVKSGFRRRAVQCHPDKAVGLVAKDRAQRVMADVMRAWEILGDPESRAAYDAWVAWMAKGPSLSIVPDAWGTVAYVEITKRQAEDNGWLAAT